MKKLVEYFLKFLNALFIFSLLAGICLATWLLGQYFAWDWGGFWLNFISNAGSSAVIGFVLYWIITRPDEKRDADQRRAQALSMLKIEFKVNLERVKQYGEILKTPEQDLTPFYPLRLTRGAWNALKESGFLPQLHDARFIFELLQLNEVIVVANKSLSLVRSAKVKKSAKAKLARYAQKAVKECAQIEARLIPILAKLESMRLPEIVLPTDTSDDSEPDEDETDTTAEEAK